MTSLSTGEVAKRAGVEYQTVLYYEKEGLIEEPPRAENGYRQYPPETVRRIRFIQRANQLGFSLEEVASMLELEAGTRKDCQDVQQFAESKLEEIQRRLAYYRRLEDLFQGILRQCEQTGHFESCPVVDAVVTGEVNSRG